MLTNCCSDRLKIKYKLKESVQCTALRINNWLVNWNRSLKHQKLIKWTHDYILQMQSKVQLGHWNGSTKHHGRHEWMVCAEQSWRRTWSLTYNYALYVFSLAKYLPRWAHMLLTSLPTFFRPSIQMLLVINYPQRIFDPTMYFPRQALVPPAVEFNSLELLFRSLRLGKLLQFFIQAGICLLVNNSPPAHQIKTPIIIC